MSDTNVYVMCSNNCKYPSMTKEQIMAAIAEATGKTPTNIDDAFITKIKEQNKGGALKVWRGTTAEYNAIVAKNGKDPDTVYIKTDDSRDADIDAAIRVLWGEVDNLCTYVARKTVEGLMVTLHSDTDCESVGFTRFSDNAVAIPVLDKVVYDYTDKDGNEILAPYALPIQIMGNRVHVFNTRNENVVAYIDIYEIGAFDGEGTGGGVGTEKDPTVNGKIEIHNVSADAHSDIRQLLATANSRLNYLEKYTVLHKQQTLTEEQKTQARGNIGAVSDIYMAAIFGELKAALEKSDIDGAIAVLDEAILDLSTLA